MTRRGNRRSRVAALAFALAGWSLAPASGAVAKMGEWNGAPAMMVDGKPVIGWDPALTEPETDRRRYQFFGRSDLGEGEWEAIPDGHEEDYNFFKVVVEMP